MKQQLEIVVKESADAFQVSKFLQSCKGVKKAYVTTCQTLRVYYDDKTILPKAIAKLIGSMDKAKDGRRKNNIVSMREINDNKNAA